MNHRLDVSDLLPARIVYIDGHPMGCVFPNSEGFTAVSETKGESNWESEQQAIDHLIGR